ncbi:alpha/beta hydrolase [Candidatus Finniella inopinata]|uniref:Alpha/beta fold hydrolase n=1 Tax=Candidatus Finniella inopinata TaxID=1696036 RepID=A0A4Q7DJT4_9PROT|nr:alpha/beta hydrolase [Candidatus Finniella inopinata]RZI47012.1 alpha/beta fold hydrolase [Candidatus Finniella inopinata]
MPEVIFNGSAGRLEGRFHPHADKEAPVVLILHPHPAHGGTMNSKIVHTLHRAFSDQGFTTLRFNFRGIGRSEGSYDKGEGELSDAASALDWLQSINPQSHRFWVAGFSFGAWIGMQLLMRRPELEGFVSISPPASLYDFNFLAPCPASGLIVQGLSDTIVSHESVGVLVNKLRNQKGIKIDFETVENCDHFFTQHLSNLQASVSRYLQKRMQTFPQSLAS